MGKKLNLSHLTDEECEQIMDVLQKDFEVRRSEKRRINDAREELHKEQSRISLLKDNVKFQEENCIVCMERYRMLFRRKRVCDKCKLNICSNCCEPRPGKSNTFVCKICTKEKAYRMLSNQWLHDNAQFNAKHFGSSKVVRSLYKRAATSYSDTEIDSGYTHSSCSSAHASRPRPRLDNVFDINMKDGGDEIEDEERLKVTTEGRMAVKEETKEKKRRRGEENVKKKGKKDKFGGQIK